MKTTQFTAAQSVSVLKQHENGIKFTDIARTNGISKKTIYRWRGRYGGMEISNVKRQKEDYNYNRPHRALKNKTPIEYNLRQ